MEPGSQDNLMRNNLKLNSPDSSGNSRKPGCASASSNDGLFTSAAHEMSTNNGPVASSNNASTEFQQNQPQQSTSNCDNAGSSSSEANPINVGTQNSHSIDQGASSSKANHLSSSTAPDPNNDQCQKLNAGDNQVSAAFIAPSTSGNSRRYENEIIDNSGFKESRKRPSSLKLNRPNFNEDGSSSDTGNDDYSLGSEDGCIYTYRGGEHLADLPSSFFSLDMGLPVDRQLPVHPNYAARAEGQQPGQRSRASSPDMDFLEMDFDPGPSCEADSGDEPNPNIELEIEIQLPIKKPILPTMGTMSTISFGNLRPNVLNSTWDAIRPMSEMLLELEPTPSTSQSVVQEARVEDTSKPPECGPYIEHVNARGEKLLVCRTMTHSKPHSASYQHVSSGDLVSQREAPNREEDEEEINFAYQINQGERPTFDPVNVSSALYHQSMVRNLMNEDSMEVSESHAAPPRVLIGDGDQASGSMSTEEEVTIAEVPRSMVWSEREACERQVTQIGTSACGATAVVNVFNALGIPVNIESINTAVGTRLRANHAPLPRYLMTRATAGCTAADLVAGLQKASDGLVTARFFPTHPERMMSLSHWLADWISLGAVPILTLNLQAGTDTHIPDAWHHQMVFGVSTRGVYLCNPAECVSESVLWPKLTSPSVLLVRTRDVLTRFTPSTDLMPLMLVPDRRWHSYNVLGQVVHVIREWRTTGWCATGIRTRHIRIPVSYQAGITVAALTGSEAHRRLMHAPQLPLLREEATDLSPNQSFSPHKPSGSGTQK